jgi:hypothetical protein
MIADGLLSQVDAAGRSYAALNVRTAAMVLMPVSAPIEVLV